LQSQWLVTAAMNQSLLSWSPPYPPPGAEQRTAWTSAPDAPAAEPMPEHLVPILAQLLTGATDVTASQRLGMSPRTFSRRVSELLEHLGVASRFQAGVASVNQGWLVQRHVPPARHHH
jgi:DNA-binding NarL/FixJ family response regulator